MFLFYVTLTYAIFRFTSGDNSFLGTPAGKYFTKRKLIYLQTITDSGCDAVTAVRVEYKVDTSDTWKSVQPDKVTTTYVTIDSLTYDRYEVRLVAINNENIKSTSGSKYVDLRISK